MQGAQLPGGIYPQADTTRAALGNAPTSGPELRFPLFQRGFTPETYSQFGIAFAPADAQGGKKKGLALLPYLMGGSAFDFGVCDRGQLEFESSADIRGVGVVVRPPLDVEPLLNLAGAFRAVVRITEKPDRADEIVLIGSAGGSRGGQARISCCRKRDGELDPGPQAAGDSSGSRRRTVMASAEDPSGLDVARPVRLIAYAAERLHGRQRSVRHRRQRHVDLGPVGRQPEIRGRAVGRQMLSTRAPSWECACPLRAVVENVGVRTALRFQQGSLGPVDIDTVRAVGVGLSIDSGIITGGGFVSYPSTASTPVLQLALEAFTPNAVG